MVEIKVPEEEIISRLSGRRVHVDSGRVYHVDYNPPKDEGLDDETGEALIQRDDDQEDTIKERLKVYREQTEPLVAFYKNFSSDSTKYFTVEGSGTTEEIWQKISAVL